MSWLSSIFGGQNKTLNSDMNQFGSVGGFATGQGEADTSKASNFWQGILSGDQSKVSQLLAPSINNIKTQTEQGNKTRAEFGNRSGGTNAKNQTATDSATAQINDAVSGLTGQAATTLGSTGSNLLSTGLGAYSQQANASQMQAQNWAQSIFGKGLTSATSSLLSFGLHKL